MTQCVLYSEFIEKGIVSLTFRVITYMFKDVTPFILRPITLLLQSEILTIGILFVE